MAGVAVGVMLGVGVKVGLGVTVGVEVGVGLGVGAVVMVGDGNCAGPQPADTSSAKISGEISWILRCALIDGLSS
jgi:hypothetical protein